MGGTRRLSVLGLLLCLSWTLPAENWRFQSPDSRLQLELTTESGPGFTVSFAGTAVLRVTDLDVLPFKAGQRRWRLLENGLRQERIRPAVPVRNALVDSRYRQIRLDSDGPLSLIIRLYDRALAYRFQLKNRKAADIVNETVDFRPLGECSVYFPEEKSLQSHYEGRYQILPLGDLQAGRTAHLPLLVQNRAGVNLLFNEADVADYPCLFLQRSAAGLSSRFPPVVKKALPREKGPDRNETIVEEEPYIARTRGPRALPWRIVTVSGDDRDLLGRELVYELAAPGPESDWSWVRPGKVAWDWWNANNLYGVPFRAGLNTESYKEYIDFAAEFGLEYVILDEGWSKTTHDVLHFKDGMRVDELIAYGRERGVGIILWLLWKPLDLDMDRILDRYRDWGVKGIKVDFMQRADQYMVNFYARVAQAAAQRRLLVDFHGAFKPTGLQRAFPNVLSYEGVRGLENCKWSDEITPDHDLLLPFIRMSAGPMDYTPGAMDNAGKGDFFARFERPMSQGSRVHQMAMYVVYESPLQMFCDSPSQYRSQADCARFMARIPTVWDETVVLQAKVGDYLVMARRRGRLWYLAAMTDWTAREFQLDLSFLPAGDFRLESVQDGPNADRMASDHVFANSPVKRGTPLSLQLASGGGWLGIISPVE